MWSLRRQDGGDTDTDAGMEVLLEQAAEQQRIQQTYDDEIARDNSLGGISSLMASIRDLTFGDEFGAGSLRAGMANSPVVPGEIGDIEGMLAEEERAFDIPPELEVMMAVVPGGGGKGKGPGGITDLFKSLGKNLDPEDGRTLDKLSNQPKTPPTSTDPYDYKDKFQSILDKTFPGSKKPTLDRSTEMPKIREMLNKPTSLQEYKDRPILDKAFPGFKKSVDDFKGLSIRKPSSTPRPSDKLRHRRASLMGQLEQDKKLTQETRQRMGGELREIERLLRGMGIDPDLMAAGGSLMYKKGYYGKSYK